MEEEKKVLQGSLESAGQGEGDDWQKFCIAFDKAFYQCLTKDTNASLFVGDGEGGGVQIQITRRHGENR